MVTRFVALACALSCSLALTAGCDAPSDHTGETSDDLSAKKDRLAPGDFVEWQNFADGKKSVRNGVDDRFASVQIGAAAHSAFRTADGEQKIDLEIAKGETKKNGDVALVVGKFPVKAGEFYKAWLRGTVRDSNNLGFGFCGTADVNGALKEPFRSQVQIAYQRANGTGTGLCYCNLCPVKDGDMVQCSTDQWQVNASVSDDGACKAPGDAAFALVTIEAVAKPPNDKAKTPGGKGTAVIERFRFGRCNDEGRCNDALPGWYGKAGK